MEFEVTVIISLNATVLIMPFSHSCHIDCHMTETNIFLRSS